MLGKKGIQFNDPGPQPMPFLALRDDSDGIEGLGSYLYGDFWVSYKVVVPARVRWRSDVGGDHKQTVAIRDVHHRCRATLSALGTCGREQEQGPTLERTSGLVPVRAELLNQLAVVIFLIGHDPSFCRYRPHWQLPCLVKAFCSLA